MSLLNLSLTLILLTSRISTEKIDDSIHYYLSFTDDATKIKIEDPLNPEINDNSDDLLKITTRNNERFVCKMPVVEKIQSNVAKYDGPSPDEMLKKELYSTHTCSYLYDVYWAYQVCHGRYLTQFHEEKSQLGQVVRTEYFLGSFHEDFPNKKTNAEILNPQKKRIENEDYPYYSVDYNRGTTCDVTGKPRTTKVIYICVETLKHKLLSVTEVASCQYEVIIMTNTICNHPSYKLAKNKDHEILCWNEEADDEESAKPKALQNLHDFHDSTFQREYTITKMEDEIEKEKEEEEEEEEEKEYVQPVDLDDLDSNSNKKKEVVLVSKKRFENKFVSIVNAPAIVEDTLNNLFANCFVHEGDGFWKYEFCYGKHILQYHEEPNGHKTKVMLGYFDEEIQKAWVEEEKATRGLNIADNQVFQVSNIYTKGDICEETGAHRKAVVKYICERNTFIAVSITEPEPCNYSIDFISGRFCEIIQYAEDSGIIRLKIKEKFEEIDIPKKAENTEEDTNSEDLSKYLAEL